MKGKEREGEEGGMKMVYKTGSPGRERRSPHAVQRRSSAVSRRRSTEKQAERKNTHRHM